MVGRGNMSGMTNRKPRLAPLVLLTGGLALSACSGAGGTDDGGASASGTAAATSATVTSPATTAAPHSTAPAITAAPESDDPEPTSAGGPDRCHTSELTGSLAPGDAAAGNRYATLTLTNTGGEVCSVYGYGGLGLVGQDGSTVPSQQERIASPDGTGGSRTTLQPGQAVSATLRWTVVATGDEPTTGACEPTPDRLTVIPPDETDSLSVAWSYGPVCGAGQIQQTPYAGA